ncbi:DUF6282 family protein [Streptomyces sp. NPDC050560]|uniref:DUF6282 family protein n=1 Tax=Streptomyces sp. NPDC050560 TaxID=3365630 RepID=UPI0037ADEDED
MSTERADLLLRGALDLHAHGYPEFTLGMPPRVDNVEWGRLAVEAGLRGYVVKSHLWPTTTAAHMLRALYPQLEVFGSITLNPPAGGLSPVSVEVAAQTGAKVVWMPTWSARQDPPRHSVFLERMRPWVRSLDPVAAVSTDGVAVTGDDGALLPEVLRILDIAGAYGMTVASGHLPIADSLKLSAEAGRRGVRFVLTHPLSGSVGATVEQQLQVVEHGGMIEHVFIGCMPMHQRMDPRRIVEAVEAVGAEHCVMSSDAIEAWNPPQPEVLRMFIATLLALGVPEDAVHAMTHDNPARALGLPPHPPQPAPGAQDSEGAA